MEAKNPRKETNKTETEAIKQKPKRGRKKKILSKEDIEARIEKQKAYQMEYRQKQKLKFQAKKIPQTERVTRSKSSRISAVNNEGEKEQTVIKPKPKRKLTNKKYDQELKIETQNALKFLENQLMELCPATVVYWRPFILSHSYITVISTHFFILSLLFLMLHFIFWSFK